MIKLGQKVRDKVTGYEGIAISKINYLNGCVQFGVKGEFADGKMPDAHYIDDAQLEVIDDGIAVEGSLAGGRVGVNITPRGGPVKDSPPAVYGQRP